MCVAPDVANFPPRLLTSLVELPPMMPFTPGLSASNVSRHLEVAGVREAALAYSCGECRELRA